MTDLIRKIADQYLQKLDTEERKKYRGAEIVLSKNVQIALRQAFGPLALPFFDFYIMLRRVSMGMPAPEGLFNQLWQSMRVLFRLKSRTDKLPISPLAKNAVTQALKTLRRYLNDIEAGRADQITWRRTAKLLASMIETIARDKQVYLRQRPGTPQTMYFPIFQRMTEKEQGVEVLKDEDPEMFDVIMTQKKSLQQIDAEHTEIIRQKGWIQEKAQIHGRLVLIGKDPSTGEQTVFDRALGAVPVVKKRDENGHVSWEGPYIDALEERDAKQQTLYKKVSRATIESVAEVRSLSEAEVDALSSPVETISITDDQARSGKLTRILTCKTVTKETTDLKSGKKISLGIKVVSEGRFKGCFVDDLVNANGRLVEGTAYEFKPKTARTVGRPMARAVEDAEPYVTAIDVVEDGIPLKKLLIQIPKGRGEQNKWVIELRNRMFRMAGNTPPITGSIPSLLYQDGSSKSSYQCDTKDFLTVQKTIGSMALSAGAAKEIQAYFNELSKAEQATAKENLGYYTKEHIGGFKKGTPDLLIKQKQALAWLDSNDNNGLIALDTGIGKSLICVTTMQKFIRDGATDPDYEQEDSKGNTIKTNGKFLYVCPKSLKGNIPKEIFSWLSDTPGGEDENNLHTSERSPAKNLRDRVDIMAYEEWKNANNKGKWKGKPWSAKEYIAIFFDEAQAMADYHTRASEHALKLDHPHKICLTASPMEQEPMQAYVLAAISKNIPLLDPARGAEARKDMRRFAERYCEKIGTRIVGIKDDPILRQELDTWVKRNLFFADKTDVEEFQLPKLTQETVTVDMEPEVETVYRTATRQFANVLEGMVVLARDKGASKPVLDKDGNPVLDEAGKPQMKLSPYLNTETREQISQITQGGLKPIMMVLNGLQNRPDQMLNTMAEMMERGTFTLPNGKEKPTPKGLLPVLKQMSKSFKPVTLRNAAKQAGNPKIKQGVSTMQTKLTQDPTARAIYFTDDVDLVPTAAQKFSEELPGYHIAATKKTIRIFKNGSELDSWTVPITDKDVEKLCTGKECDVLKQRVNDSGRKAIHYLPFIPKPYKKFPDLPSHTQWNRFYESMEWQSFVLNIIVKPDTRFTTCVMDGQTYQFGHNLQSFNTVIHLDRDSWNGESMKQRTARAWRQGQKSPVHEITIDSVYGTESGATKTHDRDATLDEIRKHFQTMEGEIFDAIIKEAQGAELGKDWLEMRKMHSSFVSTSKDVAELILSPYAERSSVAPHDQGISNVTVI